MKKRHLALGLGGGAIGALVAWKFLSRAASVDWNEHTDKIHHAEHSNFVEIDGATVHYQEFGERSNPTLILIHGYTASTYVWQSVAPMFAENNFHVIAVDLLGFGYSDKPSWFDYKISSQARMISRLMDRLGIGRATLVGSSYGGAVSATLALDYAERVEKLVLVDAVCNDEVLSHPILKFVAKRGIGEFFTPFLIDSKRFMKIRMKNTLAPANHHLITKDRIESVIRPLCAADAHRSVLATSRNWDACRIESDAQFITQPTLIVWGENDKIIPMHNAEKLFDSILKSHLIVLKDCGHVPQEERPELFAEIVTEFCRDKKSRIKAESEEVLVIA